MTDQILKEFGLKIREIRIMRNMTQQELADKCDLSLPFINLIENNKRMVSLETLIKILSALNISLSDFFIEYSIENKELSSLIELLQSSDNQDEYIAMFTKILKLAKNNA